MDTLQAFHAFGTEVEKALSASGVTPPTEEELCAVLVVVGTPPQPPLVGTLDHSALGWKLSVQISAGQAVPLTKGNAIFSTGGFQKAWEALGPPPDIQKLINDSELLEQMRSMCEAFYATGQLEGAVKVTKALMEREAKKGA